MKMEEMWQEAVLQARLRYVQFKKMAWMFETLICVVVAVILNVVDLSPALSALIFVFALLRVLTEALNHDYIAQLHNVGDQWRLLYPFI